MVESRNYIYLFDYIGGNIDKAIKIGQENLRNGKPYS